MQLTFLQVKIAKNSLQKVNYSLIRTEITTLPSNLDNAHFRDLSTTAYIKTGVLVSAYKRSLFK